jgi:hypothetical protein
LYPGGCCWLQGILQPVGWTGSPLLHKLPSVFPRVSKHPSGDPQMHQRSGQQTEHWVLYWLGEIEVPRYSACFSRLTSPV